MFYPVCTFYFKTANTSLFGYTLYRQDEKSGVRGGWRDGRKKRKTRTIRRIIVGLWYRRQKGRLTCVSRQTFPSVVRAVVFFVQVLIRVATDTTSWWVSKSGFPSSELLRAADKRGFRKRVPIYYNNGSALRFLYEQNGRVFNIKCLRFP